jgi:23S rRNA (cytidine1920-2'-O)/16S rRNA (cytidine1409-2'-O)-methyltransferase
MTSRSGKPRIWLAWTPFWQRKRPILGFRAGGSSSRQRSTDSASIQAAASCLDLGASTGGFTEVLLAREARRVYAVDVGRGQLHPRVAADPRVVSLEATDARVLGREVIPEPIGLLVCDVSFISLKLVLPTAVGLLGERARLVLLVKPQFEAGRAHLRKGIVRAEEVHRAVCDDIAAFAGSLGLAVDGVIPSPIDGGDGNREFLLGARRG